MLGAFKAWSNRRNRFPRIAEVCCVRVERSVRGASEVMPRVAMMSERDVMLHTGPA